jgi:hypothetical protein
MLINDGGNGYMEISPYLNQEVRMLTPAAFAGTGGMSGVGVLGSSPGTTIIQAADRTVINAAAERYRLVSYGIRLTCTQSPLNAQGRVIIRTVDEGQIAASTDVATTSDQTYVCPLNHNLDLIVVPNFIANHQYHFFQDITYANAVSDSAEDVPTKLISVCVTGGTTGTNGTPVISVEIVKNWECLPDITSISRLISSPPGKDHYAVKQSVANARTDLRMVSKKDSFLSHVRDVAYGALRGLGNAAVGAAGRALHAYLTGGASIPLSLMNTMAPVEVD